MHHPRGAHAERGGFKHHVRGNDGRIDLAARLFVKSVARPADVFVIADEQRRGRAETALCAGVELCERTFFIEDGVIRGAVLLNDKASMMAVKAMIGREAE